MVSKGQRRVLKIYTYLCDVFLSSTEADTQAHLSRMHLRSGELAFLPATLWDCPVAIPSPGPFSDQP